MAIEGKFTEQMAFVGTVTQDGLVTEEAKRRRTSKAAIIRAALDARYGLVDGEQPKGDTPEQ